ncbi:ABC transporter permease [Oceanispirochaeta crateris]|uniref:Transport permease protein n=1 Tax=Oceanispirochaeta crateris TaxID=2518645 RepID=A0A5C1QGQ4_9SPIO|nr:ABC transporter permease [Oceanispirochaeta crateris]QEN07293.1 ABC transporter permease [Oceanispirochaeta crateris]
MKQFRAMVKARTMEFVRDKGTFYWNLLFPLVLVFGFSFAFSSGNNTLFKVGLTGPVPSAQEFSFLGVGQIEFIEYEENQTSRESLIKKVRHHQLDMVIDFVQESYFINSEGENAEILQILAESRSEEGLSLDDFKKEELTGKAIRYVDWLVPGIIGMNMLFSCLFGVGFVIVRYRKNGVLKRLKATPVTSMSFILAQMTSRFLIVLATSVVVFTGTNIFLHFMMLGSYFLLLLITSLAILCMIALGLIFAARIKSEELASGLMNLITFPMIIFSGVFFSLEGTPVILQRVSKLFPLTHFIEGARKIMLEGADILTVAPQLLILTAMTLLFLVVASLTFKWD